MTARIGVVTFPGSLDDRDAQRAVRLAGAEPVALWHADADLQGVDAVVLPGGFSYGDYLRAGAIARFAPAMTSVVEQAGRGLPVLGICNGFQVLCESGLLPGALTRNAAPALRQPRPAAARREHRLRVDQRLHSRPGARRAGEERRGQLRRERPPSSTSSRGRAASSRATSASNPNGSAARHRRRSATRAGNVVGIMPHPEHAVEDLTGPGTDGLGFFTSVLTALVAA